MGLITDAVYRSLYRKSTTTLKIGTVYLAVYNIAIKDSYWVEPVRLLKSESRSVIVRSLETGREFKLRIRYCLFIPMV